MDKLHIATYGVIKIPRAYCKNCKRYALIIDKIIQCCDMPYDWETIERQKRMVEALSARKRPSSKAIKAMLLIQNNKCLYCEIPFGTSYMHPKTKKLQETKVCCDHFVPYCYSKDNRDTNFVLACGTCNSIKSSLMFNTLEEARTYVQYRRAKKGYRKEIYIL
jgi:hypothetical protein